MKDTNQVIFSSHEYALSEDGAGFWNNEDGWTTIEGASVFTASEKQTFRLPVSTSSEIKDPEWMNQSAAIEGFSTQRISPKERN